MLYGILVALRRARSHGTAVHAAPRPAPSAGLPALAPVALMATRHWSQLPDIGVRPIDHASSFLMPSISYRSKVSEPAGLAINHLLTGIMARSAGTSRVSGVRLLNHRYITRSSAQHDIIAQH